MTENVTTEHTRPSTSPAAGRSGADVAHSVLIGPAVYIPVRIRAGRATRVR